MYCHIDVLAARNLAATDADGLTDPVYEIQVGSKKMRTSNVTAKSLNPTFMQRVCIPIEVGSNLELPPVVFKMLDYDAAIEGAGRVSKALTTLAGAMGELGATLVGGELMEVGTVVIKEAHARKRERERQGNKNHGSNLSCRAPGGAPAPSIEVCTAVDEVRLIFGCLVRTSQHRG